MSNNTFALDSQVKTNHNNIPTTSLAKGSYYGYACFVICGSCFWCASDLSGGSRIQRCLACNAPGDKVESIPLAPKEKYIFDFDAKRGIVLDFAPRWFYSALYACCWKSHGLCAMLVNNHYAGFGPATANMFRKMLGLPRVNWDEMKQATLD